MIELKSIEVWNCECDNCGHIWQTKTSKVPKVCPKCSTTGWNKDHIENGAKLFEGLKEARQKDK